jgi:hypothetical protein
MIRTLFPACALALLAGCSSVQPPRLTVPAAVLADRSADGAVVCVTLRAENPNDEALPLREVRYALWLDGKEVFRGVRSPEATIRGFGGVDVPLPAAVPGSPGAGTSRYRVEGELQYLRPGALSETLAEGGLYLPTVAFSREGEIDLGTIVPPVTGPARDYRPARPR